jgi:membrane dipeptidase
MMRFFDAHCDTIGPLLESAADFLVEPADRAAAAARGAHVPHITLPALKTGAIGAQVFASWVWSGKYKGREFEAAMAKVEAVRRLCADHPDALFLASTGADLAAPFGASADCVVSAGVRLLTLAWDDTPFCGSAYGGGTGLTKKGIDLVAACESLGVIVDVSHLSDQAFADVCRVAESPFIASHSNCRALCPSPRNMTDEMIRTLAERGGVMGINFAPGFLSADYFGKEQSGAGEALEAIRSGSMTYEQVQEQEVAAMADVPLPSLSTVVDHVTWAIDKGGEDCVGLGGDLDGVDYLPAGFQGAEDYPRIEELLRAGGLTASQVDKVCHRNMLRVFQEILG